MHDTLYMCHRYGAAGRSASLPLRDIRQRAKHTVARTPIHRSDEVRFLPPIPGSLVRSIVIKFHDGVRRQRETPTRTCKTQRRTVTAPNDYPCKLSV